MPAIKCKVIEATLDGDVKGVVAECLECGHTTESFGTGEGSRKRCLVLMREECPNEEENFYVDEDD